MQEIALQELSATGNDRHRASTRTTLQAPTRPQKESTHPPANRSNVLTVKTSLASLPHEILVGILSLILVRDKQPILLRSKLERHFRKRDALSRRRQRIAIKHPNRSKNLDLLLVCKPFYFAGIEAYYGGNELAFDTFGRLKAWLGGTASDRRQEVRAIALYSRWSVKHRTASTTAGTARYEVGRLKHKGDREEPAVALSMLNRLPRTRKLILLAEVYSSELTGQVPEEVQTYLQGQVEQGWEPSGMKLDVRHSENIAEGPHPNYVWAPTRHKNIKHWVSVLIMFLMPSAIISLIAYTIISGKKSKTH